MVCFEHSLYDIYIHNREIGNGRLKSKKNELDLVAEPKISKKSVGAEKKPSAKYTHISRQIYIRRRYAMTVTDCYLL